MKLKMLSGPLIREIVNVKLPARLRQASQRVYQGGWCPLRRPPDRQFRGVRSKENANLQANETFHKKKADFLSKESYLLMIRPTSQTRTARRHPPPRPRILGHAPSVRLDRGIFQDGSCLTARHHTSVAGPASTLRLLYSRREGPGRAQTNFASQGFFNFTVFMAPT